MRKLGQQLLESSRIDMELLGGSMFRSAE